MSVCIQTLAFARPALRNPLAVTLLYPPVHVRDAVPGLPVVVNLTMALPIAAARSVQLEPRIDVDAC